MTIELPLLVTFIGYLCCMLMLGFYAYKKTNNQSDYILGGRSLSPSVAALSVGASDMSGWLLLGLPGAIYVSGVSEAWIGIGLVVGAALNWIFVAKRLRVYTHVANDSQTLPDFLSHRFADTGLLKTVAAIAILVFFTFYTASGLVAGAILFEEVFGLDYFWALIVGTLIIVSYTFVGGFFAVSWTDFFQGILMLLALIVVPTTMFFELGGTTAMNTLDPSMFDFSPTAGALGLISLLAWGLGYFGQPHILVRFMAIAKPSDVRISRNIAMSWMILALIGSLATGLVGAVYFADAPLKNSETVFIFLSNVAFNPWVSGFLIAAILSAIMSTVDSQLLVSSSVISEDFYRPFINPKATDKELMLVGRIAVVSIAVIALLISLDPKSSVLGLVSHAWAGFGAAFGPLILLSLYWIKYNKFGAIASIVSGATVVIMWTMLSGGLFDVYSIIPGFIVAAISGVLVSLFTPDVPQSVKEQFNTFKQQLK